jgi:hypothetical protein
MSIILNRVRGAVRVVYRLSFIFKNKWQVACYQMNRCHWPGSVSQRNGLAANRYTVAMSTAAYSAHSAARTFASCGQGGGGGGRVARGQEGKATVLGRAVQSTDGRCNRHVRVFGRGSDTAGRGQ